MLVALLSGAPWVPYLGSFPITLLLTTLATFILALVITKLGHVSFNLFVVGTSLVFQPQKAVAYQAIPARVLCPVSSLASVPLQSGCLSTCLPNLTIVKGFPPLSLVFSLEANGHSEKDLCKFKLEKFYCFVASEKQILQHTTV